MALNGIMECGECHYCITAQEHTKKYKDGKDLFFGYVVGHEAEFGYFNLSELQGLKGSMVLTIERDMYFRPCKLSEIKKLHERQY